MNQPFFGSVGSALKKRGAVVLSAALTMLCVLVMQLPSHSQAAISVVGDNTFVEGSGGGTTSHAVRISVAGPANQTYRVSYVSRSGPIDPLDTSKPRAEGGGQLSNDDFVTGTQTVNIGTGGGGFGAANVGILVNADQYDEGDSAIGSPEFNNEYFYVEIVDIDNTNAGGPGNTVSATNNKLECVIIDDDAPPVLRVETIGNVDTNVDSFVAEGNPGDLNTVYARVLADHVSGKSVVFRYRTYTGTAAANSDFTAADTTVTIAPNTNTENQNNANPAVLIAIPIIADTLDEADETITVDIRDPGNTIYGPLATVSTTNFTCLPVILDDDAPVISISDTTVIEGDDNTGTAVKATFQVKMSTTSVQTVTCSYTTVDGTAVDQANIPAGSGLPADYTDTGGTLTFAPGETTKFVSVPILGDTIAEGTDVNTRLETFTVRLGGGSLGVTFADLGRGVGRAQCTINDDDPLPQLFFGPPNQTSSGDLTVNETDLDNNGLPTSSTANFVVSLSSLSGIPVTFDYSTSDGTAIDGVAEVTSATNPIDYRSTTATLTFTPGETSQVVNYIENDALGVPQFRTGIPIFGDNVDETDENFFVNLSNVKGATILDGQAQATIVDNDGPDVSVTGGTVGGVVQGGVIGQEGNTGTTAFDFTVSLSAASVQTVTVVVRTADITATGGADYNAITNQTLTFLPGETNKTVRINVIGDITDERDETFALNIVSVTNAKDPASSANGISQSIGTILDDDATPSITITDASLTEGNNGTSNMTFTVQLSAATFQRVTCNYATANGTALLTDNDYIQTAGQLSFTPGETSKAITVPIIGDTKLEADENFTVTVTNVVNADAGSPVSDLQGIGVILNDDSAPAGLTISPTTISTSESGSSTTFTVKLDRQPTADVSVQFSSGDTTEGLVSVGAATPANFVTLTFTSANYNVAQTITVTGVDDTLVDGDVTYLVTSENAVSTDPLYSGLNAIDVSVTNQDDEVPGFRVTPTRVTTTEGGGAQTFTVRLNVAPTADVTIPISSSNTAEGTVSPASLTFTSTNFSSPQTVTVTGVDDISRDGDQAYIVVTGAATSTDARYSGLDPADVNATNIDNETPGIVVTPTGGLRTTEAGGTATFTVRLSSSPTATVTIPLRSNNAAEGKISTASQPTPVASLSLTFDASNFNVPQTVTVTGQDDAVDDGNIAYAIVTDPAISTDSDYNNLNPSNVSANNTDNENPEIRVSPTSLTTNENSGTATFTVVLVAKPSANVVVPVASSNAGEGTVFPASLTFTPANYDQPQTVIVTVVDDFVDDGDVTYSVQLGPATGTDATYNGLSATLPITNVDNDTAGITVSPASGLVTTEAGGSATFNVVLRSQPTQNVIVGLSSSDNTEGSVAPASLTFTAVNWNTPQTVTVTGVDDQIDDGSVSYSVVTAPATSSDTKYNGIDATDVTVANTDNDTRGVTVTPVSGLQTTEAGGTATFSIVLRTQPTADVRIPVRSTDTSEGKPNVGSVLFTASNWNVPQTVTAIGVGDSIDDGNIAYQLQTLAALSNDLVYAGFDAADVALSNLDDDTAGVSVSPTSGLTTSENGASATFRIRLLSQPTADVTIDLSSNDTSEGVVSPAKVIFTADTPPAGSPAYKVKWNTNFAVTVIGVNDGSDDGHFSYRIITSAAQSTDANYSGRAVADVILRNLDDDDKTSPLVTVTNPKNGASYSRLSQVTGTASDPNNTQYRFVSGLKDVQIRLFRFNNAATAPNEAGFYNPTTGQYEATATSAHLIPATYNASNGTWTANLPATGNPASLAEGKYQVVAFANDNAGNTKASTPINFTVDATVPTVTITTPTEGTSYTALTQAKGTATDNVNGSNTAKVEVVVFRYADTANGISQGYLAADGSFRTSQSRLPASVTLRATTSDWAFGLPSLIAARYFVRAYAIDNAGNESAAVTKNFTIRGNGGDEFTGDVSYFISIPYMDSSSASSTTTPAKAFSVPPVDSFTNQQNYTLQRYNPQSRVYEDIGNTGVLRRGEGYLLHPRARGTRILRPTEDATRKPLLDTIQEFQVTLRNSPSIPAKDATNGYNLIGDPFDPASFSAADWANARVTANIGGNSFNGTVAQAAAQNILDARLFTFDEATGAFVAVTGNLLPLKGYFVRTFVDGVQVNLKAVP